MYLALAWFCQRPVPAPAIAQARRRFDDAVADLVQPALARYDAGGEDWGVSILYPADTGALRWPVVADRDGITAISLGIPVGLDGTHGPVGLARDLLAGKGIHAGVVPPFGMIALDRTEQFVVQQDWLGMCRFFTAESGGITAFCSRPTLLATFLDGRISPDPDGWSSYAVSGMFGGDSSPVRGVRLLGPGERVVGRRRSGHGWHLSRQSTYSVDDIVVAGLEARGSGPDRALDLAADGLTATVSSLRGMYEGEISLGLSGGKDSRMLAALMVAVDWLPRLHTNEDMPAEGETARRLVRILNESRQMYPEHRLFRAGAPGRVLRAGLRERVELLHRKYDYQFPSSYVVRAAVSPKLANAAPHVSISGAGGELATGYWYPRSGPAGADTAVALSELERTLISSMPAAALDPEVLEQQRKRIAGVIGHAETLGLRGADLIDYAYLVERVRRWYSSAYSVGSVTPYLSPGFVMASFASSPEQKTARMLHTRLLERFMPEWSAVPYVSGSAASTAARVWEGDGLTALCDLLDIAHGEVAGLARRPGIEAALTRCAAGRPRSADVKALQQYASLAVASCTLEPATVRQPSGRTHARVTAGARRLARPVPPYLSALATRMAFVKRTRLGRRAWGALRTTLVGRATPR